MLRSATLTVSLISLFLLAGCATAPGMVDSPQPVSSAALDAALDAAVANPGRSADNTARDVWRCWGGWSTRWRWW